jgi:hypothetical protein
MSEQQRQEIAKKYVDKQLAIMRKHGLNKKNISQTKYSSLVRKVAATVKV